MGSWRGGYFTSEYGPLGLLLFAVVMASLIAANVRCPKYATFGRRASTVLTGLCGAAGASLFVFFTFIIYALTVRDAKSTALLEAFQSYFFPLLMILGIAASCAVITYLDEIRWFGKLLKPARGDSTVSLGQLMLLQLFVLTVLGSWTGMRSLALSRVSELDRATHYWSPRGWKVEANELGKPYVLKRVFTDYLPFRYRDINEDLRVAAKEPWLEQMILKGCKDPDRIDIGRLSTSPSLRHLEIESGGNAAIVQAFINGLGELKSLKSISIRSGFIEASDLSPLTRLPTLSDLTLDRIRIAPKTFNQLADCAQLQSLAVYEILLEGEAPLEFPNSITELRFVSSFDFNLSEANFRRMVNLRRMMLDASEIRSADIKAICCASQLESLRLWGIGDPHDLPMIMQLANLKSLSFSGQEIYSEPKAADDREFCDSLRKLALHPTLETLECEVNFLFAWDFENFTEYAESVTNEPNGVTRITYGDAGREIILQKRRIQVATELNDLRLSNGLGNLQFHFDPIAYALVHRWPRQPWLGSAPYKRMARK